MKLVQTIGAMGMLAAPIVQLTAALPMSDKLSLDRRAEPEDIWKPISACKNPNDFLLTFHDGPSKNTKKILDKLQEKNVSALFFLNGNLEDNCIYDYATVLQELFKAGHDVGSHTWSHANLTDIGSREGEDNGRMKQELDILNGAMDKILGFRPKYFSPPFGERPSDEAVRFIVDRKMTPVTFTIDTQDKKLNDSVKAVEMFKEFVSRQPKPESGISLMRDLREKNIEDDVIGQAIDILQAAGYKLVNAETCFGEPDRRSLYVDFQPKAALPPVNPEWATSDKQCDLRG